MKAEKAGTYAAYKAEGVVLTANNELIASTEDVVADGTQYILAQVAGAVGFNMTTPGTTIAAGKGYLVITGASVKDFYPIADNATGISGIFANSNDVIYNIAGQRINKALKGVNIVNGKKILK